MTATPMWLMLNCFEDNDLDGYGQPGSGFYTCPDPDQGLQNANDCDDSIRYLPGDAEPPNGIDDNCNLVDEVGAEVTDIGRRAGRFIPTRPMVSCYRSFQKRCRRFVLHAVYAPTGEVILQGVFSVIRPGSI